MTRATTLPAWLCALGLALGCSGDVDNDLPESPDSAALRGRLDDLEKDVSVVSANDRHREQGLRLAKQTLGETHEYLAKLYRNINDTRPQDLPEWQEMYATLTDDAVLTDDSRTLGPRRLKTNLRKLQEGADAQGAESDRLARQLEENQRADAARDKALEVVMSRLATIDRNLAGVNAAMEAKFKAVDKTLKDYDGRIDGIENRMQTLELDVDAFRREFVAYRQRVTNIEELLRRYDLPTMHNDIRNLKTVTANHDERLIALLGMVQVNSSEIAATRRDLTEAEQELAGAASEIGTLKAGVREILVRLENCGCI